MSSSPHHKPAVDRHNKRIAIVASALAFATGGLLLAGCGGSSSPSTGTITHQAQQPTLSSQTPAATTSHSKPGASKRAKAGAQSNQGPEGAVGASGHSAGHRKATSSLGVPKGPNPCVLVTGAEAQAIVGAPIAGETEAPLGPTCILKVKGRAESITLAVESLSVMNQVRAMRKPQKVTVGGHSAYCGNLGRPMLDVSLAGGKILNVTAPCAIAEALAAKALPRITA